MTKQQKPKDHETKIESDESPEKKEEGLLDIKELDKVRGGTSGSSKDPAYMTGGPTDP